MDCTCPVLLIRFGSVRFGSVRFRSVLSGYQFHLLVSIDPVSLDSLLVSRGSVTGSVRLGSVRLGQSSLIGSGPVSLELSLIRRLLSSKFRLIRLLITVSSGPVSGPVLCPVLSPVGSDPATRGRSDRLPVPRSPFVPRVAGASCGRSLVWSEPRLAGASCGRSLFGLLVTCLCRSRAGFPV